MEGIQTCRDRKRAVHKEMSEKLNELKQHNLKSGPEFVHNDTRD